MNSMPESVAFRWRDRVERIYSFIILCCFVPKYLERKGVNAEDEAIGDKYVNSLWLLYVLVPSGQYRNKLSHRSLKFSTFKRDKL